MSGNTGARKAVDRAGLFIALILAIIAAVVAWDASHISVVQSYARVGPKAFPYVIAGALAAFAILTAIEALKGAPEREPDEFSPVLWILGGLAAQTALVSYTGFSIATGLLFAATAKAFGRGNFAFTIPAGIAISFVLWFLFAKGLSLTLPIGPLERLF